MVRYRYILEFVTLYILFCFVMLLPYKVKLVNQKGKRMIIPEHIICLIWIIVSSIRLNSGSDYWAYYRIYNDIKVYFHSITEVFDYHGFQSGIHVLSYILKETFSGDTPLEMNVLFIVIAIFSYIVIINRIRKNSKNTKLSIMLYMFLGFFLISNNILKQQVAMSFMLIAYDYLYEKKYLRYVILCIAACFFHISAIIPAITFLIIHRFRLTFRMFLGFFVFFLSLTLMLPYIARPIAELGILGSYSNYIANISLYAGNIRRTIGVMITLVMYAFIFWRIYRFKEKIKSIDTKTYGYIALIFVGIMINAVSINLWVINRIAFYFYQYAIFLVPNTIEILGLKKKQYKKYMIIIVIFTFLFSIFYGENTYYSYHTVFDSSMEPTSLENYVKLYE